MTAGNVGNIYNQEDEEAGCKFVSIRLRRPPEEPETVADLI